MRPKKHFVACKYPNCFDQLSKMQCIYLLFTHRPFILAHFISVYLRFFCVVLISPFKTDSSLFSVFFPLQILHLFLWLVIFLWIIGTITTSNWLAQVVHFAEFISVRSTPHRHGTLRDDVLYLISFGNLKKTFSFFIAAAVVIVVLCSTKIQNRRNKSQSTTHPMM